jgi:hypothetical protein
MNLKRKPPTVRQNHPKKPRPSDEKTAASALLSLANLKNNVGKTDDEIIAAETLLSFGVDQDRVVSSTNTEMSTVHSDHGVFPVCTKEKESLTDVTFVNVDQEFHEEGNEKSETLTIRSTQVIYLLSQSYFMPKYQL